MEEKRERGDIGNERKKNEQWKNAIIRNSAARAGLDKNGVPLLDQDRSWQSIHDIMMDEYQKSKQDYPGNLNWWDQESRSRDHIDKAKKMHGILKSHENQLTNGIVGNNKIYKITKSKLKAGIHHSTSRSWLAPLGKPQVNFGPDKKKVTLELEGEKERMEKFREAEQRYRNNQDVEAQLDNARRREEQLRNRRLLEEQLRNRALVLHDADNVAPNRPKGGKKRKRKTRRRKTRKHKKKHRKRRRTRKHKKHKRKRKTKRR